MRMLIGALAASVMLVTPVLAEDAADPMGVAYGNTVTITNVKGEASKLFIEPDNTYSITLADGTVHKGTWSVAEGQTCFAQTDPAPAPDYKPACNPTETGRKVGDTWEDGEGETKVTVAIVAGR